MRRQAKATAREKWAIRKVDGHFRRQSRRQRRQDKREVKGQFTHEGKLQETINCCVRQCHASAQATWRKLEEKRVAKKTAEISKCFDLAEAEAADLDSRPIAVHGMLLDGIQKLLDATEAPWYDAGECKAQLQSLQEMARQITAAAKPSNTAQAPWTLPESLAASPAMSNSSSHQPCPLLTLWQQHNLNSYSITDSLSQDSPYKQQQLVGYQLLASSQAKVLVCRKLRLKLIIQYST